MTTISHPAKRRIAIAGSIALVPLLAACGFGAQTNQSYQSSTGTDSTRATVVGTAQVDNSKSPIQVYDAVILISKVGSTHGLFIGSFVNNSAPDPAQGYTNGKLNDPGVAATVTSVTVGNGSAEPLDIALRANTSYNPSSSGPNKPPTVTVPSDVTDGGYVPMVFTVASGGNTDTVTMNVPVYPVDSQTFYRKYAPLFATPAESSSPKATTTAQATPLEKSSTAKVTTSGKSTTPTSR